ncbi:MAG: cytochrome c3 family protein [Vicinamibacteria bacterium]
MAQLFPKVANQISKASLALVAVGAAVAGGLVFEVIPRSAAVTRQREAREQPVPFYHLHHVGGMGIDCRYCHTSVDKSATAGIPPTKTCMNCHSQIFNQSPTLEPVRASWRTGTSIPWVKVHDLPDYVYFNHSAHVNKGVGCTTCHGPVDKMPYVYQEKSLLMEWCLDCHKQPEKYLRPKSEVYSTAWRSPSNQLELGRKLKAEYDVKTQITCSTCHR